MASAVNSLPAGNAASNTPPQNPTSGGRSSLRSSAVSAKGPDGGRRQTGSPVDGAPRRAHSQKAWTQATNPITQKPSYAQQQNGTVPHRRPSASPRPTPKESNTPDSHAHDRLIFLFTSFIGLNATITTKSGEKFSGIFSSSSIEAHDSSVVLKMVQKPAQQDSLRSNGVSDIASPYLGSAPDHSMTFDVKDIADVSVANVSTTDIIVKESNGASAGFRTDSDISGHLAIRERTLQRWEPSADTDVTLSLDSAATGAVGWDQFEANERLFGTTTSYDENIYTTQIDRKDPLYKQREAEAARIAREIEGVEVDNPHVREERGLVPVDDSGQDEEDKYSGVRRGGANNFAALVSGQPNKYTPPARRAAAAPAPSATETTKPAATVPAQQPVPVPAVPDVRVTSDEKRATVPAKPSGAVEQKNVGPAKTLPTSTPVVSKRGPAENATANVETEVLDQFRQFANSEKLKMQERRRNQASYDRTVKLNELMKFSQNFKLATPVPKDLVPILAKDPQKQEQIIQKAQMQAQEITAAKAVPVTADQKPLTRGAAAAAAPRRQETAPVAPLNQLDRPSFGGSRGSRPAYPPSGPQQAPVRAQHPTTTQPGRPGTGMLSHRLADNLQQRKGAGMAPVPSPLPIQDARIAPSGPAGDQARISSPQKAAQTPTTSALASKFNVRAMEFKPNPTASTFTPGGPAAAVASSPQPLIRGRSISRATTPSAFFGAKKPRPATERPSLADQFNPIKRMKQECAAQTDKDYKFNGGIPPAYKTPPTWEVPPANEDKTYLDIFTGPLGAPSISPPNRAAANPQMPLPQSMSFHGHQTSANLPPGPGPAHGAHHGHHHPPQHQPHHPSGPPPPYEEHQRIPMSASTSQMFPSPRLQHSHVAYPSPMAAHAHLAYNQPAPQYYVNQGGPQPAHMRHYPGGPQFVGPQGAMGGAPMMVQQPSSGPYMGVPQGIPPYAPQMQMYSPAPAHAYPQHAPPPQPHSGYPSPSRGAPMMMHQGSQSGQPPQPVMFMSPGQQHGQPGYGASQPGHMPSVRAGYPPPQQQQQPLPPSHYSSSPRQMHHFPSHPHRTPSNGHVQVPQMVPQAAPPPPAVAPSPHQPETPDEVK